MVSPDAERRTSLTIAANALFTSRQVEGLLFWGWLGGYKYEGGDIKSGRLLTIEELGEILKSMHRHSVESIQLIHHAVPVNLKERDEFHLTLEEYLQSLISLVEELVRKPDSQLRAASLTIT